MSIYRHSRPGSYTNFNEKTLDAAPVPVRITYNELFFWIEQKSAPPSKLCAQLLLDLARAFPSRYSARFDSLAEGKKPVDSKPLSLADLETLIQQKGESLHDGEDDIVHLRLHLMVHHPTEPITEQERTQIFSFLEEHAKDLLLAQYDKLERNDLHPQDWSTSVRSRLPDPSVIIKK